MTVATIRGSKQLSRRTILRASAVSLGLPLLDAMLPLRLRAEAKAAELRPKRIAMILRQLGTNAEYFFPTKSGLEYEATRNLKILEPYRGRFTVFSGMSHVGYPNSHHTSCALLTGVSGDRIPRGDDIRNTISLDPVIAKQIGRQTRIPHLVMGYTTPLDVSYNEMGVPTPGEIEPQSLFNRLFTNGSPEELRWQTMLLEDGKSILDTVNEQLKDLRRDLGIGDRNRLDVMEASIRKAEQHLRQDQAWVEIPKPTVKLHEKEYGNVKAGGRTNALWLDLTFLALQTDQTRIAVVSQGDISGDAPGATIAHHDASHHGQDPNKVEQFAVYEEEETRKFKWFLDKLAEAQEGGVSLLDQTITLRASNIGNPSAHASNNLPILVAGGGLKHQGHVTFDKEHNKPLSNLYVRLLQQMGLEIDSFGSSAGMISKI